MKGDRKIIEFLNQALKAELTAINQYFLHSRMYEDWGLKKLAEKEYEESIDEMKHADEFIKRILFLGGLPNLQDLGRLRVGEGPIEAIRCDLELEHEGIELYRNAVEYAESVRDYVSRDLFQTILEDEEGHVDWLETQLELVERIGEERYLQSQMGD
ncbi:bacterioferritin [Wenzhouxiangella sp. AB-CW3]|uniref:bacterioferritin n=1 Tax=Wenzhouxiangella sp. AB-CW3 TaxID=2771012 RepID=UPI00168BC002|nr:bacterioferritin [Wenzhouxiangella sp. AB-CW3]QOC21384.1 bacterioferritin [Wenzhouxiangella sp. AB-CW3]